MMSDCIDQTQRIKRNNAHAIVHQARTIEESREAVTERLPDAEKQSAYLDRPRRKRADRSVQEPVIELGGYPSPPDPLQPLETAPLARANALPSIIEAKGNRKRRRRNAKR